MDLKTNMPLDLVDQELYDAELLERIRLLSQIRKTPEVLNGIFLEVTRQMYSTGNNTLFGTQDTVWSPDPTKSKMWIDTEFEWADQNPEFRPAIYIKLGGIKYKSLTGRHDSLMNVNVAEGELEFSRNGTGTVTWVHIGSSKGESVALNSSTLDYVDGLSRVIRDDFCFQTFEVVSVSPLILDKESKERYRSHVTASFTFQDTWAVKRESPKLKRIILNAGRTLLGYDIFLS